ncbi:hypothetical protein ACEPAI_7954 [Sanghuangporus weigelae]
MVCPSRWKRLFGVGHGRSPGFTGTSTRQDSASFTTTSPTAALPMTTDPPTTTLSTTTSTSPTTSSSLTTTISPHFPRHTDSVGSTSQVNQFTTTISVSVPASTPAITAVTQQRSGSRSKVSGIVGGVAGSLAALILITLTILCIRRKWLRAPPCIRRKLREKDVIVIGTSEEGGGETACNTRPSELGGGIMPQNTLGNRARSMEPTNEPEPMDTGSQEPSRTENPFVVVANASPSPFISEQRTQKANQMRQRAHDFRLVHPRDIFADAGDGQYAIKDGRDSAPTTGRNGR